MAKINPKIIKKVTEKEVKQEVLQGVDVNALLKKVADLEKLVRNTWDTNKIKEYEDAKTSVKWFSFSIKLWPTEEWDYPIINWKMIKNYVANEWKDVDQRLMLTYVKDWKELEQEIKLVDFVRILKRTDPILANRLINLDWSEVYVDEKINAEEDIMFYVIKPKADTFKVNINYNNEELTILSTYLNA